MNGRRTWKIVIAILFITLPLPLSAAPFSRASSPRPSLACNSHFEGLELSRFQNLELHQPQCSTDSAVSASSEPQCSPRRVLLLFCIIFVWENLRILFRSVLRGGSPGGCSQSLLEVFKAWDTADSVLAGIKGFSVFSWVDLV